MCRLLILALWAASSSADTLNVSDCTLTVPDTLDCSFLGLTGVLDLSLSVIPANVSVLILKDNAIRGFSPGSLQALRGLRTLDLSQTSVNFLSTIGFPDLENLGNLTELNLSDNQVVAHADGFFELLPGLRTLKMNLCLNPVLRLNGTFLTRLSLSHSNYDDSSLASCSFPASLRELDVSGNRLLAPTNLPVTLTSLFIGQNLITKANVFRPLVGLETLNVARNEGLVFRNNMFSTLVNLRNLDVSGTSAVSPQADLDIAPDLFAGLSRLTVLRMNSIPLRRLPLDLFDGLDSLEQLEIQGNQHSSFHQDQFKALPSLSIVDLSDNVLLMLPAALFDSNPNLIALIASGNPFRYIDWEVFPLSQPAFVIVDPYTCTPGTAHVVAHSEALCVCAPGFFCPRDKLFNFTDVNQVNELKPEVACPLGSANTLFESRFLDDCLPCPAGSFMPFDAQALCGPPCQPGHVCEDFTDFVCPPGTHNPFFGRTDPFLDCLPCAPGTAQAAAGQFGCLLCEAGKFSALAGASRCTDCAVPELCGQGSIREDVQASALFRLRDNTLSTDPTTLIAALARSEELSTPVLVACVVLLALAALLVVVVSAGHFRCLTLMRLDIMGTQHSLRPYQFLQRVPTLHGAAWSLAFIPVAVVVAVSLSHSNSKVTRVDALQLLLPDSDIAIGNFTFTLQAIGAVAPDCGELVKVFGLDRLNATFDEDCVMTLACVDCSFTASVAELVIDLGVTQQIISANLSYSSPYFADPVELRGIIRPSSSSLMLVEEASFDFQFTDAFLDDRTQSSLTSGFSAALIGFKATERRLNETQVVAGERWRLVTKLVHNTVAQHITLDRKQDNTQLLFSVISAIAAMMGIWQNVFKLVLDKLVELFHRHRGTRDFFARTQQEDIQMKTVTLKNPLDGSAGSTDSDVTDPKPLPGALSTDSALCTSSELAVVRQQLAQMEAEIRDLRGIVSAARRQTTIGKL